MKRFNKLSGLAVLVFLLTASIGVAQPAKEVGVAQRSSSWATNLTKDEPTAGIDVGAIVILTLKCGDPKGVTVAFWSDRSSGFSGTGTGQSDKATYKAEIRRAEMPHIQIDCITTDSATAVVKIGKRRFEVSGSALFLIDSAGEEPRLRQLNYANDKLPKLLRPDAIVKYAMADESIRGFWESTIETSAK